MPVEPQSSFTSQDNIYERVGFLLHNALAGDPDSSVRSLLAPATLSPKQHRTIADEIIGPENTGLAAAALRTITNPLVLVGAALAWKFPIARPELFQKAPEVFARYGRYIPAPLRGLLGLNEIFAGTPIPRIYHRIPAETHSFIEKHFAGLNEAILAWRKAAGRLETPVDQIRWGVLLDGGLRNPKGLETLNAQLAKAESWLRSTGGRPGARLARLSATSVRVNPLPADRLILDSWRKTSEGVRGTLSSIKPEERDQLLAFLRAKGAHVPKSGEIQWLSDYFPHVGVHDKQAISKLQSQFADRIIGDPAVHAAPMHELAGRLNEQAAKTVTTSRLAVRSGILPPSSKDLALLAQSGATVDKGVLESLEQLEAYRRATSKGPASYTLRFSQAAHHYAHSVGRAYAWTLSDGGGSRFGIRNGVSLGRQFVDEINAVRAAEQVSGISPAKSELLRNAYLPMALGHGTFEQTMRGLEWNAARQFVWNRLDSPKLNALVPAPIMERMRKLVADDGEMFTAKGLGNKISGYIYLSTLGGNVGSAFQNLTQQLLTTAPLIGADNAMKGFASVLAKGPELARALKATGSRTEAMWKVFPEFMERELDVAPVFDDVLSTSRRGASVGLDRPLDKLSSKWDWTKQTLMSLFHNSEAVNRLSAFYGARVRGLSLGLNPVQAGSFAQEITEVSQLWSGGAALPSAVLNWWPPFRQFASFGGKTLGALAQSVLPGSGGLPAGLGYFNPGTLGRAVAYSAGAYELVKATTGADISRSLIFGALPQPRSDSPFGVLPFVPPVLDVAGGLASDLLDGTASFEQTKGNLPLLAPGGVAAARMTSILSPEIAQALGRTWVDFDNPTPDGLLPVMTPDGRLISHQTPWQVYRNAFGGGSTKFITAYGEVDEPAFFKYILAQRERLREMRRDYIRAIVEENDWTKAEALNREHLRLYGIPITVRPQDWEAAELNATMPRLDRVMETLPRDVRPQFQQLSRIALAPTERFLGIDPGYFGSPSRKSVQSLNSLEQEPETAFTGGF